MTKKISSLNYFFREFKKFAKLHNWQLCCDHITNEDDRCPLNLFCYEKYGVELDNGVTCFYPYFDKDLINNIYIAADGYSTANPIIRNKLLSACSLS
jgi:hypothetical protein